VRLLMQKERDAGRPQYRRLCDGYRGSPLGSLDQQFMRAGAPLANTIVSHPATNEDLAPRALGSQQAGCAAKAVRWRVRVVRLRSGVDRSGAPSAANLPEPQAWRDRPDGRRSYGRILDDRASVEFHFST
jgi:hypothetical protein